MTNSPLTGTVSDVQHFSVSDGPGIRTVVFLKGCPLRCAWCHNPETYLARPQIMVQPARCLGCGACEAACPRGAAGVRALTEAWRQGCTGCGGCVGACPAGALETVGRTMTPEQVLAEVAEDAPFFEASGGGMTISGGEPMFQPDFTAALARSARAEGIHVAMETSGFCPTERLMAVRPLIDLFLFDYKLTGEEAHRRHTGVGQALILRNLRLLDEAGAPVILRCPIIPGVNLCREHARGIAAAARSLRHLEEVQLEPYHNVGLSKRERLGMPAGEGLTPPDRALMEAMAAAVRDECGRPVRVM